VGYRDVSCMEIRISKLVIKALMNNGDRSYGNMDVNHVLFKMSGNIVDKKIMQCLQCIYSVFHKRHTSEFY